MAANGYSDEYDAPWLSGYDPTGANSGAPNMSNGAPPPVMPDPAISAATDPTAASANTTTPAPAPANPMTPAPAVAPAPASWNAVTYGAGYDETGQNNGAPDMSNGTPPDPNAGAPNTPEPGNDENQIQGWASQWLGRTFNAAELQGLKGQPLDLVMHNIANSPEALAYAASQGGGAKRPPPPPGSPQRSNISVGAVDVPPWLRDAPTYQPGGYLDTTLADMPGFADLYAQASRPTPHQAELDSLVSNILQHPESLSEQDVATLKAKAAENAAVAGQAQDEDLQHFGFSGGLNDSPWLAGQRAQNAWGTRNSQIQANQNVDIAAADRRSSDRLAAANLGTSYSSYQSGRHTAALNLALDGALAKYGEQRNRTSLNASMDQAAAQSGQSKAQLISNYVLGATGQQIDVAKLNQQGDQFMQDLAYRVSQLKQQSDQFDADMQLALQKFQHTKDQDAWTQAHATYAA